MDKKKKRKVIVDGVLWAGALAVDVCASLYIGAVGTAIAEKVAKPIIKKVIKVGAFGTAMAVSYGVEAARAEWSSIICYAMDKIDERKANKKEEEIETEVVTE